MTALTGLLLWAAPSFAPAMAVLGSISGAILGFFQSKALGPLAPSHWTSVTAVAGAIGLPLSLSFAFPFLFLLGNRGIAVGGLILGFAFGTAQFLLLRRRYANTWPWILISSAALGIGFLAGPAAATALSLGFYPPFSPGWTAIGTVAGLVFGTITGIALAYSNPTERAAPAEEARAA